MYELALSDTQSQRPERDFHGAAVLTADGREIPITEEMVQRALDTLERSRRSGPVQVPVA